MGRELHGAQRGHGLGENQGQSSQFIVAGALRGAGDTKFVAKLTFYTVLLLRPGLAILAVRGFHMGLPGAWLAITTDCPGSRCACLGRCRPGI